MTSKQSFAHKPVRKLELENEKIGGRKGGLGLPQRAFSTLQADSRPGKKIAPINPTKGTK